MSDETIDTMSRELWNRAKAIYISQLHTPEEKSQVERYFSMITTVSVKENSFVIMTSNKFASDLLKNDYAEALKNCIELAGGDKSLELKFEFDESARPAIIVPVSAKSDPAPASTASMSFVSTMPLNPDYTFAEFVRGPSNSWAYDAAMGVVKDPGKRGYNPLFIHGGTGLGKTHIMQAIGNEAKKRNPLAAVCYLTAERFLNEYVSSLQNHCVRDFRERYRKIDILLVDDIQFMSRGKDFQEEFFNTFNSLHQAGKQIVMTSDVAPKDLPGIEARLISRFEWGMVQEIEMPSYETRLAILRKKTESIDTRIGDETLKFIALNIKSHVRAMEGALAKVGIYLTREPGAIVSEEVLKYLLKDFIDKEQERKNLTIEEVQKAVARKYNVSVDQILSSERTQSLVTPRQLAMYIARKFCTKGLTEIAEKFEKTHATIINGVKRISERLDVEEDLKRTLEDTLSELGCRLSEKMD